MSRVGEWTKTEAWHSNFAIAWCLTFLGTLTLVIPTKKDVLADILAQSLPQLSFKSSNAHSHFC